MNAKQRKFAINVLGQAYEAKAKTGLPASILAAQCILETGWGTRVPRDMHTGKFSYNLFGIKGKGQAGSVAVITHEYIAGKKVKVIGEFRAYYNYAESFVDYGNLILGAKRYKTAVIFKSDPVRYIREIWKAGYATDPKYPEKILKIAVGCDFISHEIYK